MRGCLQEFYEHFQELEGPKRLLGFSKAGQKHYATPGVACLLLLGHARALKLEKAHKETPVSINGQNVMELSCAGLYREGDWLLFGAETTGLPEQVSRQLYASVRKYSHCNAAVTVQLHDLEDLVCLHMCTVPAVQCPNF